MDADPPVVLDTSALVAVLLDETGADVVHAVMHRSRVSTVNVAETIEVLARKAGIHAALVSTIPHARIEPFDAQQANTAGNLLIQHRRDDLSLGDACCLALAISLGAEVFTADRAWTALALPVQVRAIR